MRIGGGLATTREDMSTRFLADLFVPFVIHSGYCNPPELLGTLQLEFSCSSLFYSRGLACGSFQLTTVTMVSLSTVGDVAVGACRESISSADCR